MTIKPAVGGGVAITDASGANARLRVAETGEVWIPVLAAGAQQTSPVCSGAGGQLGPCAANAGGGSYTAATGLTLTGTTFAVAPPYQLPQGCAANQVPQWTGAAWACAAMSGGGSGFTLPYAQTLSDAGPLFALTNSGAGGALKGVAHSGSGVYGESNAANGIGTRGFSGQGTGVYGSSDDGTGVSGTTDSTTGGAGVHGSGGRGSGDGVFGESMDGTGVHGKSENGDGVQGHTVNGGSGVAGIHEGSGAGVYGVSADGRGVEGHTTTGSSGVAGIHDGTGNGVYGYGEGGDGVHGVANGSGNGVYGQSASGYAMNANGPATQALNEGGWVKAMAYVHWDGNQYEISRCFNSQLPPGTAGCGFTVTRNGTGKPELDFGFPVNHRFVSATLNLSAPIAVVINPVVDSATPTKMNFAIRWSNQDDNGNCSRLVVCDDVGPVDGSFWVIIF
ncbi:MAG: hypothetical protein QM741_12665 [Rudaea sp.]|uniref:hypothetical protein n=1 Tax=Rudaea sp. TaxID=2136325 RepID=UPI0039E44830